jgi:hypothetical protein
VRLKELEKRLEKEPGNLGLRVTVAGLLREAGRSVEAVELYRSVAIAYRDQGRVQQAIAVCRSILEIAPDDRACQGLLAQLTGSGDTGDGAPRETPLPRPVPHHIADPTSEAQRLSPAELADEVETRPGVKPLPTPPRGTQGLAEAARRISGMISGTRADPVDLAAELDTRKRPRVDARALHKVSQQPPPTVPVERLDTDEIVTPPSTRALPRDSDDELTLPREKLPSEDDPTK